MTPTLRSAARRATVLGSALALSGALLALGSAGPAAAAPATLIQSCPYTILAPGLYVLARDLTCPGPAITVTADNVRLNLGGHTLTGPGGEGFGVSATGTESNPSGSTIEGLRVENGTVRGFTRGISINDAPGVQVVGVTATGNVRFDILVADSPDAQVSGNTASGNDFVGILVWDSPRSRVTGNTASRNGVYGIAADNCDGCEITGNRTDGNGQVEGEGQGITLFDTTGARVARNTSTGNGQAGIRVLGGFDSSTDNRLESNRATGNGVDLVDENLPACVNTWLGNRFATDNEGDGPGAGCIR